MDQQQQKAEYHTPELKCLGTVSDLTQAQLEPGSDNSPMAPNGSTI
jgi:hypothetical protein